MELSNDDLTTLSESINVLKQRGFDKDFQIVENGLKATDEERAYTPEEVKILNFFRFEGETDPADMSILYAIETSTGIKGTLVDAYGTYANSKVTEFIGRVHDIHKKTDSEENISEPEVESHISVGK